MRKGVLPRSGPLLSSCGNSDAGVPVSATGNIDAQTTQVWVFGPTGAVAKRLQFSLADYMGGAAPATF